MHPCVIIPHSPFATHLQWFVSVREEAQCCEATFLETALLIAL